MGRKKGEAKRQWRRATVSSKRKDAKSNHRDFGFVIVILTVPWYSLGLEVSMVYIL